MSPQIKEGECLKEKTLLRKNHNQVDGRKIFESFTNLPKLTICSLKLVIAHREKKDKI